MRSTAQRRKTAADIAATGRLTEQGYTARRIADELGISERNVVRHRAALGISQPAGTPFTDEEDDRIEEMAKDGVPLAEIARTLGRHSDVLYAPRFKHLPRGRTFDSRERKLRKELGL